MIIYQGPETRRSIVNGIYDLVKPYLVRSDSVRIVVGRYTKVDITGSGIVVEGDRELYRRIDAGEDCAPLHFLEEEDAMFGSKYDELTDMIIITHDLLEQADDAQKMGIFDRYFKDMKGGLAFPFVAWDLGSNPFDIGLRKICRRLGIHFDAKSREDYTLNDVYTGNFDYTNKELLRELRGVTSLIGEFNLPSKCVSLSQVILKDHDLTGAEKVRTKLGLIHKNLETLYRMAKEEMDAQRERS